MSDNEQFDLTENSKAEEDIPPSNIDEEHSKSLENDDEIAESKDKVTEDAPPIEENEIKNDDLIVSDDKYKNPDDVKQEGEHDEVEAKEPTEESEVNKTKEDQNVEISENNENTEDITDNDAKEVEKSAEVNDENKDDNDDNDDTENKENEIAQDSLPANDDVHKDKHEEEVNNANTMEQKEQSELDREMLAAEINETNIEESSEQQPAEAKSKFEEDFSYNVEEFVSKPDISKDSGIPDNIINLYHSFGYDCLKRDNIHLLDEQTLTFVAGNYIRFFNVNTGFESFLRSLSGRGIGFTIPNRSRTHFAVAEKGIKPVIAIYEYPSLRLVRILRDGTEKSYSYCQFDPSGKLLATVGGDPDYMLTVWNWEEEQTVLRSKAFSQDIYRLSWSNYLDGILTTVGIGHIKFWKMADTFTGLKLQGDIGKFGKTEISDIEGYVELPDGKVLSGSEWGNILVWDGNLIKVQICRKGKKNCHNGRINQIIMDEGELMTVGYDGYIRTWDFETIDTAEMAEEMRMFEIDPMNEICVAHDAHLMHIVKEPDTDQSIWYGQDSNGRLWKLDLSFSHTSAAPLILASFHSGAIADCCVSPFSYLAATIGTDGLVAVYDFLSKKLLSDIRFFDGGCKVLWAPETVDSKGKTIITGFADGVVRILRFAENSETDPTRKAKEFTKLELIQALKPHKNKVSAFCIDRDGEYLVTGSHDNTIFFFAIESSQVFEPIGFINLTEHVVNIEWISLPEQENIGQSFLIVYMQFGNVIRIQVPDLGKFDHNQTYEITDYNVLGEFELASVKSKLRHDEELAKKHYEEEQREKSMIKMRQERLKRGLETEEDQMKQVEEEEKKKAEERAREQEWVPEIPSEPSGTLFGMVDPKNPEQFWLTMDDFDSGYFYKGDFSRNEKKREPIASVSAEYFSITDNSTLIDRPDVPIQDFKWCKSGLRAIIGLKNGSIKIQLFSEPFNIESQTHNLMLSMHDNDYGAIARVALSYDEKFAITIGRDGNFFVYNLMSEELQNEKISENKAKIPSARLTQDYTQPDDIESANAYSIEEHKQKSQHDKMVLLAEEKKTKIRKTILELRQEFKQLKEQNERLPERIRLNQSAFELVPELREDLIKSREEKIKLVQKECAFESARHQIALDKIQKRYIDQIECDLLEVIAFKSPHRVSTIRGCNLSKEFFRIFDEMEKQRLLEKMKETSREATKQEKIEGHDKEDEEGKKLDDELSKYKLRGARGMRVVRQMKKLEENKQKRIARKKEWESLYNEKPAEDYENPLDKLAIKEAKEKMGDFKLKSSNDYVVPENQRLSAFKKRTVLLDMEKKIFHYRSAYNAKVLKLRDNKLLLIDKIKQTNEKLIELNQKLPNMAIDSLIEIPEIQPCELPEKKFEYSKESLLQFKKHLEQRRLAALKGEEVSGFGAFGKMPTTDTTAKQSTNVTTNRTGPGAQPATATSTTQRGPNAPGGAASSHRPHPTGMSSGSPETATVSGFDFTTGTPSNIDLQMVGADGSSITGQSTDETLSISNLQRQRFSSNRILLEFERTNIRKQVEKEIRMFDTELRLLRHEKFKLELILKRATMQQLTIFEEYRLLKEYEISERVLSENTEKKSAEKLEMTTNVSNTQAKIEEKKKDIEKLQEKERAIYETFKNSLGENNKFADYLTKVFKKKIKRRKKDKDGAESDDSEDSSDSDDSDFDDDEEESDDEGVIYDLDMCPPGCSQELYDNTCQLRENRTDIEEKLVEEKKLLETWKKELENLIKKTKAIEQSLNQAERELEMFQIEKQKRLNELDTIVILKMHQILHHENGNMTSDLSQSLVFESTNMSNLKARIQSLAEEKLQQKKQRREAKARHLKLLQNRKLFQQKITETQEKCDEMMKMKFGKVTDMEKMEMVMINPKVEELTFKMLELQDEMLMEQAGWEKQIKGAQEQIITETKQNTLALNKLCHLYNEKNTVEHQLNSKQKNLGTEFQTGSPAELEEIGRLMQLVQIQAQELDALKDEIGMLSKKGGHILPPVHHNVPSLANTTLEPYPLSKPELQPGLDEENAMVEQSQLILPQDQVMVDNFEINDELKVDEHNQMASLGAGVKDDTPLNGQAEDSIAMDDDEPAGEENFPGVDQGEQDPQADQGEREEEEPLQEQVGQDEQEPLQEQNDQNEQEPPEENVEQKENSQLDNQQTSQNAPEEN